MDKAELSRRWKRLDWTNLSNEAMKGLMIAVTAAYLVKVEEQIGVLLLVPFALLMMAIMVFGMAIIEVLHPGRTND